MPSPIPFAAYILSETAAVFRIIVLATISSSFLINNDSLHPSY